MLQSSLVLDAPQVGKPAPIILRPYQEKARNAVLAAKDRGLQRVLAVSPTGTGKTTLFSDLVGEFHSGYGVNSLIIAHREELLQQASARISLQNPGLHVGVESGSSRAPWNCDVVVAGIQSIGRAESTKLDFLKPGFLIVDEAHHAPADSYQNVMRRFGSYEGECFTIGVTATPHRLDNKPLHGHESAIFEEVVFTYTLAEAIADGWLCDLRGFRVASGISLDAIKTTAGDYNQGQLQRAVNIDQRNRDFPL
jgi:superfamily II DNA or RNA helicase